MPRGKVIWYGDRWEWREKTLFKRKCRVDLWAGRRRVDRWLEAQTRQKWSMGKNKGMQEALRDKGGRAGRVSDKDTGQTVCGGT